MNKSLRPAIIAGNWKMNNTCAQAKLLINDLIPLAANADCGVILCVPYTDIYCAAQSCLGSNISIGAQNCHWAPKGAFTGEISAEMLLEAGAEYVIIGHSERRQFFGETDATVNKRLHAALDSGLKVILCVGELLEQRERGITQDVCTAQVKAALEGVTRDELSNIIIAYEPVWAIGTGKTATPQQANDACAFIRSVIASMYDKASADAVTIQYGGSMNAANASELLSMPDIDGGLIGGASLKAADFAAIISAAK